MADDEVDLDRERQSTDQAWQGLPLGTSFIPLPLAAAVAFHRVYGDARSIVERRDYEAALDIAAAALSRLISLYSRLDGREPRKRINVDLTRQHFARGATELRARDGTAQRELSVERDELLSALSLIKQAGMPLHFALLYSLTERAPRRPPAPE